MLFIDMILTFFGYIWAFLQCYFVHFLMDSFAKRFTAAGVVKYSVCHGHERPDRFHSSLENKGRKLLISNLTKHLTQISIVDI